MINLDKGLVTATHGNNGDMLFLNGIYHACNALFNYDKKEYISAFTRLESFKKDGVFLRGVAIPPEQIQQYAVGPDETVNWWAVEGGETTSRDQLQMAQCAFTMQRDQPRSRRHFIAWVKRFGFAQNTHPNYKLPSPSTKKIPDIMTPSMLALFIRGCEYKYFYWLLPILDLGLVVDWWLAKEDRWDYKLKLTVIAISCNHIQGNRITKKILKKLFMSTEKLHFEFQNWFNLNGCAELDLLVIRALWRELNTGV